MIKIIACLLMLTDHIGAALFPEIQILRLIGRLAMPMFAFMVARGFRATKEHGTTKHYVFCLLVLAVCSQIPHFMVNGFFVLNIAFSWLAAIGVLLLLDRKKSFTNYCLVALVLVISNELLEYGFLAIAFVMLFYNTKFVRDIPLARFLGALALLMLYIGVGGDATEANALYGVVLIDLITLAEEKIKIDIRPPRYAVYAFYPLHMYLLGAVKMLLLK